MTANVNKFVAEFVGTFALIFFGAGAIITDHVTGGQIGIVGIALAHGLTVATMVSAIGHISGGHINPAVTIAFLATRRIPPLTGALYIVAQIIGASLAALFLATIFSQEQWQAVNLGTPGVANINVGTAIAVEAVLTFFLVFVIFGTAVDPMGPKGIAGFGIGCVVMLDIFMGGPLTGAAMNPARAFGPALISGSWQDHILLYWLGPITGALAAGSLYHFVLRSDSDE